LHPSIPGRKSYLRTPSAEDFEAWVALRQVSRAFLEKWEPIWAADEFSRSAFRQRIRIYEQRAREDEGYNFFIFGNGSHDLLGGISLSHVRRGVSQSATLGYWMGAPYAGKGFMKDALATLIGAAHSRFGFHRIDAACLPHNDVSRHLLLKCGFQQEGYAKAYAKIAGRWEDHLLFGRNVDHGW
jgi:[ribosomal protein S5]-alanine N-acetyltransferase